MNVHQYHGDNHEIPKQRSILKWEVSRGAGELKLIQVPADRTQEEAEVASELGENPWAGFQEFFEDEATEEEEDEEEEADDSEPAEPTASGWKPPPGGRPPGEAAGEAKERPSASEKQALKAAVKENVQTPQGTIDHVSKKARPFGGPLQAKPAVRAKPMPQRSGNLPGTKFGSVQLRPTPKAAPSSSSSGTAALRAYLFNEIHEKSYACTIYSPTRACLCRCPSGCCK